MSNTYVPIDDAEIVKIISRDPRIAKVQIVEPGVLSTERLPGESLIVNVTVRFMADDLLEGGSLQDGFAGRLILLKVDEVEEVPAHTVPPATSPLPPPQPLPPPAPPVQDHPCDDLSLPPKAATPHWNCCTCNKVGDCSLSPSLKNPCTIYKQKG